MADNSPDTDDLLRAIAAGDRSRWGELLTRHQARLKRMVALRLDQRIQGRIDASDVVQEACLEASLRLPEYLKQRPMPFFLWLRFLTGQKLHELHRRHLGVKMRDARREVSLYPGGVPEATSAALAAQLLGHITQPSQAALRAEMQLQLQEALNRLEPLDREVLVLRHFEQLSNTEAARVLKIQEPAASKRYIRALRRLKEILGSLPGVDGEVQS
jgi:RNA polymerase sigma-70 factor, ECF subfamily